jgi:hypothetical protein
MKISKIEKKLEREESKVREEIKKEEQGVKWFVKSDTFKIILLVILFITLTVSLLYAASLGNRTSIEKSELSAPVISLSAPSPGILEKVFVSAGDVIPANTIVAQVSGNQIKSKIEGIVLTVQNTPGQSVSSQSAIVTMIDPHEMRVVGHIAEDKGLDQIKMGQSVIFTVDAFASKQYTGFVDSISPAPRSSDIVFSISDKRAEREFDVKVKYDTSQYPELKYGMSAKMWVYK